VLSVGLIATPTAAYAGGRGCGCESRPRCSSCYSAPATTCAAPRKHWIPAAPQGVVVPSVAAMSYAQPAVMVSPQFVTGQALSLQAAPQVFSTSAFAVPQVYGSSLLTGGALAMSTRASGLSISQLTKALKAVAESQAEASAQSIEKKCTASAQAAGDGGSLEVRLGNLEKNVESLTETSHEILSMIKLHEQRLQKIEAAGK